MTPWSARWLGATRRSSWAEPSSRRRTTAFAQSAENLYLHPLGFDDGATSSTVCDMIATDPCAAPLQVLTTPELIQQGPSSLTAADDVTLAVENEFNANPDAFSAEDPLTIFGYSQSATAESIAMTQINDYSMAHGTASRSTTCTSSSSATPPSRAPAFGQIWNLTWTRYSARLLTDKILTDLGFDGVLGNVTPTDLYPTTIYTLATDGVGDWQGDFQSGGLLDALSHLFIQHAEYLGLTAEQVADSTTSHPTATSHWSTSPTTSTTPTRGLVHSSTASAAAD